MRALGVDFGTKRVGLAVCDPDEILVSPLAVLERTTRDALFADLARIIAEEEVEAVVVGLPIGLDGQETLTTRQAKNFAESLARRVDVPVHLHDERLSSAQAEDALRSAGRKGKKLKAALDAQAAAVILDSWLRCER